MCIRDSPNRSVYEIIEENRWPKPCLLTGMNFPHLNPVFCLLFFVTVSMTSGCSGGLDNPLMPTGSHSIAFNSDFTRVAVANTDAGTVSFIDERSHVVQEVSVGLEPTRIARAGNKYFVSLRAERSVAVLRPEGDGFVVEKKIRVGAEPYGCLLYTSPSPRDS